MKIINNKIAALIIVAAGLSACADAGFDSGLKYEKPSDMSMKEYLNQFGILKSYVQKAEGSPFTIGTAVSIDDIQAGGLAFSTLVNNFELADLGATLTPLSVVNDAAEYDFGGFTFASDLVSAAGVAVFGGNLMSDQNQRAAYNNALIAPTELPAEKGYTTIDFENYEIGATVPMIGTYTGDENTSATGVVTQGDESHGKVLTVKANQGLPRIHIKLDEGRTLADCKSVMMDMKLRKGKYGSGMRIMIDKTMLNPNKSAADYGYAEDDKWKDRGILINFVREGDNVEKGSVAIPADLLSLKEFYFVIGSASGDWQADIDNIRFTWESPAQTIEKTNEEKKELLTAELEKWITGFVKAGNESVTAWNVVCDPFDDVVDENSFLWRDYLGGTVATARTAVSMARAASEKNLKLFVANTFYQGEDMAGTARKLTDWVREVENGTDSGTPAKVAIDGYTIRLNAIYSAEVSRQKHNEEEITTLFEALVTTGKPIRIADLSVMYEDELGNYVTSSDVLGGERERVGQYMAFIISQYRKLIPEAAQYGVSLAGMTDTVGESSLCPWTSDFERTEIYEGLINGLSE